MDVGEIEREKFVDGLFIVVEVLTQCVEPWCAFSIGGNRRIDGKGIGFGIVFKGGLFQIADFRLCRLCDGAADWEHRPLQFVARRC